MQKKWSLKRRLVSATAGGLWFEASGTEPVIRVMGEAYDKALVDSLVRDVCDAVARAAIDVCDPVARAAYFPSGELI